MKNSILLALFFSCFTLGIAKADNGPLTPSPGFPLYYSFANYDYIKLAINDPVNNPLPGVPEGLISLPWYGSSTLAKQYLTNWINGTDFGGGSKLPSAGVGSPGFIYNTDARHLNAWFYYDGVGYVDQFYGITEPDFYAVALSQ